MQSACWRAGSVLRQSEGPRSSPLVGGAEVSASPASSMTSRRASASRARTASSGHVMIGRGVARRSRPSWWSSAAHEVHVYEHQCGADAGSSLCGAAPLAARAANWKDHDKETTMATEKTMARQDLDLGRRHVLAEAHDAALAELEAFRWSRRRGRWPCRACRRAQVGLASQARPPASGQSSRPSCPLSYPPWSRSCLTSSFPSPSWSPLS